MLGLLRPKRSVGIHDFKGSTKDLLLPIPSETSKLAHSAFRKIGGSSSRFRRRRPRPP